MNLLQIVQAACEELGLTAPTQVIGATDNQTIQLKALLNGLGNGLATGYEWQESNKTHTFTVQTATLTGTLTSGSPIVTGLSSTTGLAATTWEVTGTGLPANTAILSVDSATQVTLTQDATDSGSESLEFTQTQYDLPSDWNYQINRTHWDRTNHWELMGPVSPQGWQYLKGGIVAAGPRIRYRILGNQFQIFPPGCTASDLAFEYISTSWIYAAAATTPTKTAFTVDTDTTIFRDRLMVTGLKYRMWSIKGFDTTDLKKEYDSELEKDQGQNKGAPTLSLAPRRVSAFIGPGNIPDGSVYGQQ
jgi:hypothetical protein